MAAKTAKRKSSKTGSASMSAWCRQLFTQRPDLLNTRSNDEILALWLADNPGHVTPPTSIKNVVTNIKSELRRGRRGGMGGGNGAGFRTPTAPVAGMGGGTILRGVLTGIHANITAGLLVAKATDPTGLAPVVQDLENARTKLERAMA